MGRPRKLRPGEDPNYAETSLWPEKRGRKEVGYKVIIGPNSHSAINQRKGRSLWTTQGERELLKVVLDRLKSDDTNITIQAIVDDYLAKNTTVSIIYVGDPPDTDTVK